MFSNVKKNLLISDKVCNRINSNLNENKNKNSFIENDENNPNLLNISIRSKKEQIEAQDKNIFLDKCEKKFERNKNVLTFVKRKSTFPLKNKFFHEKEIPEKSKILESKSENFKNQNINIEEKEQVLICEGKKKINDTLRNSIISFINENYNETNTNHELDNFFRPKRNSLPILETHYNLINYYLNDPEIKINKKVKYFIEEFVNDENKHPNEEKKVKDKYIKKPRSILKKISVLNEKIEKSEIFIHSEKGNSLDTDMNKKDENCKDIIIKVRDDKEIPINHKFYSYNLENSLINKYNNPSFSSEEYLKLQTYFLKKEFGNSILNNLLIEEKSSSLIIKNFLINHKITERMRSKMIDWIIEVLILYNCDENTFFIAINLMDRYFKFYTIKNLKSEDLHLVGVTAMFMASKYQDIYPLRLKLLKENIAYNKFTMDQIKNKEIEISNILNYQITLPTQWEFINLYLQEIFINNHNDFLIEDKIIKDFYISSTYYCQSSSAKKVKFINEDYKGELYIYDFDFKKYNSNFLNLIKHLILYLCKMNCHDTKISHKSPSKIAASTLFVALKISEQINDEVYICEYFCKKLIHLSQCPEKKIVKLAKIILNNAQNFDKLFHGLENLKKYHYEAITNLEFTK